MAGTQPNRSWIQGFGGGKIFPLAVLPGDVHIIEIARSLANQGRFAGHTRRFYSVAEHSVRVSWLFAKAFPECPGGLLPALMHDGGEAILADMARPVKHDPAMDGYLAASERAQEIVDRDFGCDRSQAARCRVKACDNQLLAAEAVTLKSPLHPDWLAEWREVFPNDAPVPIRGAGWSPDRAYVLFLRRFVQVHPKPWHHLRRNDIPLLRWPWPIAARLITRSFLASRF